MSSLSGPKLCLRVMRVRDSDENVYMFLWPEIEHRKHSLTLVEKAINEGRASVLDISGHGRTGLHVRKYFRNANASEAHIVSPHCKTDNSKLLASS